MPEEETDQVEVPATDEKQFNLGKHVRITNSNHPLVGRTGKVVCIAHHMDDWVWVDMDSPLPPNLVKFAGKFDSRHNWAIFNAEDYEEVLPLNDSGC